MTRIRRSGAALALLAAIALLGCIWLGAAAAVAAAALPGPVGRGTVAVRVLAGVPAVLLPAAAFLVLARAG